MPVMGEALKISVIVPNYNHAPYLRQRLDSIFNQSYQNFEVIILDDNSSDNSRDIIEEFRSHRQVVQIIYNETNSGSTFKQWDKSIQLASGGLIWIAESDDWCEPGFLETLIKAFEENSNCVLAYVQSYAVNGEGEIFWQPPYDQPSRYMEGKEYIGQYLARSNSIFNASMALFRKETFYRASKDYTSFRFSGDWLFWTEIARQGDVFISDRLLNYFRSHDGDVSGKAYSSGLNYIEDLRVWKNLLETKLIDQGQYRDVVAEKYAEFQETQASFSAETRVEIERLFESA